MVKVFEGFLDFDVIIDFKKGITFMISNVI